MHEVSALICHAARAIHVYDSKIWLLNFQHVMKSCRSDDTTVKLVVLMFEFPLLGHGRMLAPTRNHQDHQVTCHHKQRYPFLLILGLLITKISHNHNAISQVRQQVYWCMWLMLFVHIVYLITFSVTQTICCRIKGW